MIARDPQRSRLPLTPLLEAAARLGFAYARNQHGLRDKRPPGRFLSRTAQFLVSGFRQPLIEAQMSGLSVLVPTADRTIARSVYVAGDWDPLLVGGVFEALEAAGRDWRGTTFLEIGANFGVYSLPAVAEYGFARAVAYEPDPSSYALLERNIERNNLSDLVSAYQAALSARAGELTLSLGSGNAGDNRIIDGDDANGGRTTVRVPARTLDAEVAAGRIPLSDLGLVWLDVQGHETDVLEGASDLLAADVPIVLEYCTAMMPADARRQLDDQIDSRFDVLVDLGWSSLTNRLRFQPASAIRDLAPRGRKVETDLLLLHGSGTN